MRKPKVFFTALACCVIAIIIVLAWPEERQPAFKGRKFSYWLCIHDRIHFGERMPGWDESREAMMYFGTNGHAILLRWIRYEPPKLKTVSIQLLRKIPARFGGRTVEKFFQNSGGERYANAACFGFVLLGVDASPAVPELERIASKPGINVSDASNRAHLALQDIARAYLRAWQVGDAKSADRALAIRAIAWLRKDGMEAVPMLIETLADSDPNVRAAAAYALKSIAPDKLQEAQPQTSAETRSQ